MLHLHTRWRVYCVSASSGEIEPGKLSSACRSFHAAARRAMNDPAHLAWYWSLGTSPSRKGSR